MKLKEAYHNIVDDFEVMPKWIKLATGGILLQNFFVYNIGLFLIGRHYRGGWLILVWLATVIFFGVYVNNFRLAKNRFFIGIALIGIPLELAVLSVLFDTSWELYFLDWFFAEILTFAIAFAIGGFIRGLKKFAFGLAALLFGGLLAYSIAASFLGPLREGYGSVPNLYWLLLIIPMLTALASKTYMFIYDVNLGESILIQKFEAVFIVWILGWVFGWLIYAGACT